MFCQEYIHIFTLLATEHTHKLAFNLSFGSVIQQEA